MAAPGPGRVAVAAVALAILWRVIHVNAVLYEDTGRPRLPASPATKIGAAPSDREVLVAQLRENPGQVAALILAGREAEGRGGFDEAARAYAAACPLAPLGRA